MNVSWRHIATAGLAAAALTWPSAAETCCGGGHTVKAPSIKVPGVSVSVDGPRVGPTTHSVTTHVAQGGSSVFIGRGGAASTVIVAGGGYACCDGGQAVSTIDGLTVVGEVEEQVEVMAEGFETRTREVEVDAVVRAVCIDDKGAPHPASRPSPDKAVAAHYDGEIFRCMAGTAMQATIGGWDGEAHYDAGSTISCAKGEALRHEAGGRLFCAAQEPKRDCNERSLLRKYGPGEKLVRLVKTETYEARVPVKSVQTVKRKIEHTGGAMVFDGGVGAGVCSGC